jgi:hypothetical protein
MARGEIGSEYPRLTQSGVHAALTYDHDHDHREETSADIKAAHEWYEEMRARHPSRLQEKLRERTANAMHDTISSG